MSKFFVRITVISTAIYMMLYYTTSVFWGKDIWYPLFYLLFEFCVCLCISKQGVYHCKFVKWTAYGILAADTIALVDETFDVFPVGFVSNATIVLLTLGLFTTTTLAINHYIEVKKLKRRVSRLNKKTVPQTNP